MRRGVAPEALPGTVALRGPREHVVKPALDKGLTEAILSMADAQMHNGFAVVAATLESLRDASIFPEEIPAIAGAAPRRRATFIAGRACARAALIELGAGSVAIPATESGAPTWPAGFAGSISHTEHVAASVVARKPPVIALGIDVEEDEPLDNGAMVDLVCRSEELIPGCDASHPDNLHRGKLIFVVKEAVYKVHWALHNSLLDFHDLSVSLDDAHRTFVASVVDAGRSADLDQLAFAGNFAKAGGLLIALSSQTVDQVW